MLVTAGVGFSGSHLCQRLMKGLSRGLAPNSAAEGHRHRRQRPPQVANRGLRSTTEILAAVLASHPLKALLPAKMTRSLSSTCAHKLQSSESREGHDPFLYFLISLRNQPFCFSGAAASPAVSGGATASPNFSKNSAVSFFAVASISRDPSWASLPPTCAFTS
jgi:hypothetical protein